MVFLPLMLPKCSKVAGRPPVTWRWLWGLQLLDVFEHETLGFELLLARFRLSLGDVHDAQAVLAHRMDPGNAHHGVDQERM